MPSVRQTQRFWFTHIVCKWFFFRCYCSWIVLISIIPMQVNLIRFNAWQFPDSIQLNPTIIAKAMPVTFTVNENTPNLTTIGRLTDHTPLVSDGSSNSYTMPQNPYFDMLADGSLRVISLLDRDENRQLCVEPSYPQLCVWNSFAVTSTGQYIGLRVVVNDVNDNVPTWAEPTITIHVTEEMHEKFIAELPTAKDPDLDKNGIQSYKLQTDFSDSDKFELIVKSSTVRHEASKGSLIETTSSFFKLFLHVLKPLDREVQPTHNITLLVFDGSEPYHTGRLNIIVQVTDENDHSPEFTSNTYTAIVSEDAVIGSIVPIYEYRLDSERQSDGLNSPSLGYSDSGSNHLIATDRDVGPNGDIEYRFSASTDPQVLELFSLDKRTGHIRVAKPLSYDIRPTGWKFQVLAEDGGRPARTSSTTVLIQLKDANTHGPEIKTRIHIPKRFTERIAQLGKPKTLPDQPNNVIYIPENTEPVSEPLAVFTVGDKDTGPGGQFDCKLTHSDESTSKAIGPREDFRLNFTAKLPNWNVYSLYVIRAMDRELAPVRQLIVTCTDQGQPPMHSYERLNVVLVDENDNKPKFSQTTFQLHVVEGNQPNSSVGRIHADDPDDGANGKLTYDILWPAEQNLSDRPFIIKEDGKLIATKMLDREANPKGYNFQVVASDSGQPMAHTSSAEVEIVLDDVNDCTPQFLQKMYNFTIAEDYGQNYTHTGRWVGQVKATDCDLGLNGAITYMILDPGMPFEITQTGMIKTTRVIDREMRSIYRLTVLAQDGGPDKTLSNDIKIDFFGSRATSDEINRLINDQKVRTSAAQVQITLTDVNDNYPIFVYPNSSTYQVRLSIHEKKGHVITRLVAVDKDAGLNGQIRYAIIKGNQMGLFKVQPETGELFLDKALNHDHKGKILLFIEASDLGTPRPQTNSLEVRLILVDEPAIGRKVNILDRSSINKLHPLEMVYIANNENDSSGAIELNKLIMMCIVISTAVVCVIMIFAIGIFVRRTTCQALLVCNKRRRRGLACNFTNEDGTMNDAQVEHYKTSRKNMSNGNPEVCELATLKCSSEHNKYPTASANQEQFSMSQEFGNSPKLPLHYETLVGANKCAILSYGTDEQTIPNRYVESTHNSPEKKLPFDGIPSSSNASFHLEENTGALGKTDILISPTAGMRFVRPSEPTLCAIHEDPATSIQFVTIPVVSTNGSYIALSHHQPGSTVENECCQQQTLQHHPTYIQQFHMQQHPVCLDHVAIDSDADSGRGGSVNNIGIACNVEALMSSSIVNSNAMLPSVDSISVVDALSPATVHTLGLPLRYVSYSADGNFHVINPNSNTCAIPAQALLMPFSSPSPETCDSQAKPVPNSPIASISSCVIKDNPTTAVTTATSTSFNPARRHDGSGNVKRDCGPWRLVELPTQELEAEIQKY